MNTTRASLLGLLKDFENSSAWGEFDRIYRPVVARYIHLRGWSGPAAEDIFQETMLAVARSIGSFDYDVQRGRFRSWLRTIVEHLLVNAARRPRPVQPESLELDHLATSEPGPDDTFESLCRQEALRYCLEEVRQDIEAKTYRAFEAYVLDERPAEEVCGELDLEPSQLYKTKWRVTAMLRERMRRFESP